MQQQVCWVDDLFDRSRFFGSYLRQLIVNMILSKNDMSHVNFFFLKATEMYWILDKLRNRECTKIEKSKRN